MNARFCISLSPENGAHAHEVTPQHQAIIAHPMVAAIVVFAYNIKDMEQFKRWVEDVQKTAIAAGKANGIPLLIDHEGGWIQRFSRGGFPTHPSLEWVGDMYRHLKQLNPTIAGEYVVHAGSMMATFLHQWGLIPLGPVADSNQGSPIISKLQRAIAHEPNDIIERLGLYLDGYLAQKVPVCLKHFPGHGAVAQDSHLSQPTVDRKLSELEQRDLKVFKTLIHEKSIHAMMPAHILYPSIDPDHIVTFSAKWHDYIRNQLRFDGVLISDCLCMKGSGEDSLADKIKLGLNYMDALIICHQRAEHILPLLDTLLNDLAQNQLALQRLGMWFDQPSYIEKRQNQAQSSNIEFQPAQIDHKKTQHFQHNLNI